jgi:threonine dehydrogenase-like Zn-dependent dehydrogenase
MKAAVFVEPGRIVLEGSRSVILKKERMRRLMDVIASNRVDLKPLVTHRFKLDQIEDAYELFGHQRDGVLKVAITT